MPIAHDIAAKYKSPRYVRLETFERYVENTQMAGAWPFLQQGDNAPPVQERAPCVKYNIISVAIRQLVNFVMGEDRYPLADASSSEDGEDDDPETGLNEEDSARLERWINGPLTRSARLKAAFPEGLAMAMGTGGVALVGSIQNGFPSLTPLPAKWCTPTVNPMTKEVEVVEIFYPYIVEERNAATNEWEEKCKLYRRRIDAMSDVVYLPGDGREDGVMPSWSRDDTQSVDHGLGYCPVKWYAYDRPCATAASVDGRPVHKHLLDEANALNRSLSMRHRAAVYNGDPQIWETGVSQMTNPAPTGAIARAYIEPRAADPNDPTKTIGIFSVGPSNAMARGGGNARKKGPGVVWRYPDKDSKVGLLELAGDALDAISKDASDLRTKIAEDLNVVLIDPTDVKSFGAMSGKAIAFMFARQVAAADRLRTDAGDNLILACLDLLMRLCLSTDARAPGSVRVPGLKKVLPIIEKFSGDVASPLAADGQPQLAKKQWFGPQLALSWGRYFPPSAEEENFIVSMVVAAYSAGLMPLEVCIEKLRDVFTFTSAEEIVEKLEAVAEQKRQQSLDDADEQGAIGAKYSPADKTNRNAKPDKRAKKKESGSGARGAKAA